MWESGLAKLADVLLAPLLNREAGRPYGDPASNAMAEAVDEAVYAATAELVADEQRRAAVRGILREWPDQVDPRADPVLPDSTTDASQILTEGVRRWIATVDTPIREGESRARLVLYGVNIDTLIPELDRRLRAGIARRAQPGGPLALIQDRLDASAHHRAAIEGLERLRKRTSPSTRSAYLPQVEQIAPPELLDREPELAELAAFCTAPDQGPYGWWRAGAWAGKSALLASFVLNPPPRVHVVSFFVTARFAGQSDRVAFADVVLKQLGELLDQPLPTCLTEATTQSQLRAMLDQAAGTCQERGERLVLLVDGLDEDRGVTTGPDAHSIAALLPDRPVAGMRVIVAGRPAPPIPADVPDDHPLRDQAINRPLRRSRYAQVVRGDLIREVERLLTGSPLEKDLLGLVCAAGGGLTVADLAELTEVAPSAVEKQLTSAPGRTFRQASMRWEPGVRALVLAHEELQRTAVQHLGGTPLDGLRQRLYSWADSYRERGWPAGTPEYLLRGYFRLLRELGNVPRMARCATDQARHDRMLDISGGDTAALAEIALAQQAILDQADPDLLTMARLAVHRDSLIDRNADLPTELPAVWASLEYVDRAESLARVIPDPYARASALAGVVTSLAATDDIESAEVIAWSIDVPQLRTAALTSLIRAVASAGGRNRVDPLIQRTEAYVRSIGDHDHRRSASHSELAAALAAAGHPVRAELLAQSIPEPDQSLAALADVAAELATVEPARAVALIAHVLEGVGRLEPPDDNDADVLTRVTGALLKLGDIDRAERIAQSIRVPYSVGPLRWPANAEIMLAGGVADTGAVDRAEAIARSIQNPTAQVRALTQVAQATATAGDRVRAATLCVQAEALATAVNLPWERDQALTYVASALAANDDHRAAETLARSLESPAEQAKALAQLASAAMMSDDRQRALWLADLAEQTARSVENRAEQGNRLINLMCALQTAGDHVRAERVAWSIGHPFHRANAAVSLAASADDTDAAHRAARLARSVDQPLQRMEGLAAAAEAAARTGDRDLAAELAAESEHTAQLIDDMARDLGIGYLAAAVAAAGDLDRAEQLARSSAGSSTAPALAAIAQAHVAAGRLDRAEQAAAGSRHYERAQAAVVEGLTDGGAFDRAVALGRSIGDFYEQTKALGNVARTAADRGEFALSREIACSIDNFIIRAEALAHLTRAVVDAGDLADAESIARSIGDPQQRTEALAYLTRVLATTGDADHAVELAEYAEETARSIDNYQRRVGLTYAARAHAAVGHLDRAETLVELIDAPTLRAEALAGVAEEVPPAQAVRLLARAFASGSWTTPLDAIARIQPQVLAALADDHLARHGQHHGASGTRGTSGPNPS